MRPAHRQWACHLSWSVLITACLTVGFSVSSVKAEPVAWRIVAEGVQVTETTHPVADAEADIDLHAVRVDPNKVHVVVLDTYATMSEAGSKYAAYSLRDLKRISGAVALINGGFSQSFALPVPAGLVVQNGETTARLNRESKLQSGVFCMNDEGAKVVNKADYSDELCRDALQSGPKIVEYDGENGIRAPKNPFTRSVACVDAEGRVLLVRSSSATLYHLAEVLRAPESDGGYGCQAALNLSGDVDSGLLYEIDDEEKTVGVVDSVIASAIAVVPKSAP